MYFTLFGYEWPQETGYISLVLWAEKIYNIPGCSVSRILPHQPGMNGRLQTI